MAMQRCLIRVSCSSIAKPEARTERRRAECWFQDPVFGRARFGRKWHRVQKKRVSKIAPLLLRIRSPDWHAARAAADTKEKQSKFKESKSRPSFQSSREQHPTPLSLELNQTHATHTHAAQTEEQHAPFFFARATISKAVNHILSLSSLFLHTNPSHSFFSLFSLHLNTITFTFTVIAISCIRSRFQHG